MTTVAGLDVVVLLLPLAMHGMRGHTNTKLTVASALSLVAMVVMITVVSFTLLYSSMHRIDYAAAGKIAFLDRMALFLGLSAKQLEYRSPI